MKLKIHNVRSLEAADLTTAPLTLVLGQNQSGKTTLLNTVAALMLGDKGLYGATAKDASPVIRTGAKVASAHLSSDETDDDGMHVWSTGLVWPAHEHTEAGRLPPANEVTMGRVDPAGDFDAKQWANFIRGISPSGKVGRTEVGEALSDIIEYSDDRAPQWTDSELAGATLLEKLKSGWDDATKHCEAERLAARRSWQKATGETFGADKARDWFAEGYVDGDTEEALEAEIKRLESEARKVEVRTELLDVSIPELEQDVKTRLAESRALGKVIDQLQTQANRVVTDLKGYPEGEEMDCPHCGGVVVVIAGKLVEVEQGLRKGSDEHKALLQEHQEVQTALTARIQERGKVVAALEADQALLKRMRGAV